MANALVSTKNMNHDDWLQWRNTGIGGSDASIICGINKYSSPLELWMIKTGKIPSKEAGEAAYWGNVLEPIVRNEFTVRAKLKVKNQPFMLQHSEYKFMLANLDGIVIDPINGKCIFEAKTASTYKQDQWEDDNIPEEYILQVQHYMAVTGYNLTYIAVLIGGNQFKYKLVKRDDELIDMLIKLEKNFWNHVENDTPPPIDGSEACTELLKHLYPNSNSLQITLPDEAEGLITQYESAVVQEKEITLVRDEAANKLKEMLGENEAGLVNDRIVTWKTINKENFDSKTFQLENSDLHLKYLKKSSYRRFTIK